MFTFIAGINEFPLQNFFSGLSFSLVNTGEYFWGSLDCIYDDGYISKTGIDYRDINHHALPARTKF